MSDLATVGVARTDADLLGVALVVTLGDSDVLAKFCDALTDALADGVRVGVGVGLQGSQQAPWAMALPSQLQSIGGQSMKPQRLPRQASAGGRSWRARGIAVSSAPAASAASRRRRVGKSHL